MFAAFRFYVFSIFFFHTFSPSQAATVHVLYMNSSRNIWPAFREQCIRALFTDPQISFFINFFIKNGSHGTIHIFKNYFATVFSVFSFQFLQNKFYPNKPLVSWKVKGNFVKGCQVYTFWTVLGCLNFLVGPFLCLMHVYLVSKKKNRQEERDPDFFIFSLSWCFYFVCKSHTKVQAK